MSTAEVWVVQCNSCGIKEVEHKTVACAFMNRMRAVSTPPMIKRTVLVVKENA